MAKMALKKRNRLAALRAERALTGLDLAMLAHVNPSTLYGIENGRLVPPPDSVMLARLATALGYRGAPADLLDEVSGAGS